MRRFLCIVVVAVLCAPFATASKKASHSKHHSKTSTTLPVTTTSARASELYEHGMVNYETLHIDRATADWRQATKADPNFALGYAFVAFSTTDPAEAKAARASAKALMANVTPGEKLVIRWITGVQENDFLSGITAMNDALAMFPKDKRLFYLASNWLFNENDDEQVAKMCERALAIDKDYAAALNNLAYAHARVGDFPPAFEAMEHYIKVLPNEPNPQDSYAEILRMSGNNEGALEHYRASLKIDPTFYLSRMGLGDTYALMGDQEQARKEYAQAIKDDPDTGDRLLYGFQSAQTWVREGKLDEADKAFIALADNAHSLGFDLFSARAYRSMAMYQPDNAIALSHLEKAEAALAHQEISQTDRAEERSRILRLRVVRATQAGQKKLAGKALHELETMAANSRSLSIQQSYHAAEGFTLLEKKNYQEAIAHLQEDNSDPFSLRRLAEAYQQSGDVDDLHATESKLGALNVPILEQALVVVPFRAAKQDGQNGPLKEVKLPK